MVKDAGITLNNLTVVPPEKFSVESVERSSVIIKANTLSDKLNTAIILSCLFCEFTFKDVDNLKEHFEHYHLEYKGRAKTRVLYVKIVVLMVKRSLIHTETMFSTPWMGTL